MASAFKNFFITFVISLVLFAFLGFQFYQHFLKDATPSNLGMDTSETEEQSGDDTSSDTSEGDNSTVIIDPNEFDENGDIFTAVIMCVDSKGSALNSVFIDSNGKTKQFIYCTIPSSIKGYNEVGATIPVGDLFAMMTPEATCQTVTAMTGIETKYCLKFDREGVRKMAAMIPGAFVTLREDIIFVNPAYKDFVPELGQAYPDDYYITISNVDGKVLLNEQVNGRTKLDWLLDYNPNADGSEYNALYSQIAKSIFRQFFESENALKSTAILQKVLSSCETNLTLDSASGHLETIFSYDNFVFNEVVYPASWETAVTKLRKLDGSYK